MKDGELTRFGNLEQYGDKQEILAAILQQLEKDTGFDYTGTPVQADNPLFMENLREDLSRFLRKVSGQNQTRFMHLIYRVDITQSRMNSIEMDQFYFHHLAELVLDRMLQKVITRKFFR